MGQARDEAGNIWETDANGNPVRLISSANSGPKGQVLNLPPDPVEQARLGLSQAANARADRSEARQAGNDARNAQLQRQRLDADLALKGLMVGPDGNIVPRPGGAPMADATRPQLSAKERADAIAGYTSAQQLRRLVADLRSKFKAGPGSTSGLAGLGDYLPTTGNQQFDAAGNAARGIVGQALGFTGGQLNTAAEANMAVGPYLPQASDRDEVILDKIQRLEDLSAQAEKRSIAILGGVPDANGRVTPAQQQQDPVRDSRRSIGDIGFALPNGPQNPLGPDQQNAYDAFNRANPNATADQLRAFVATLPGPNGGTLQMSPENAQRIIDARAKGLGVQPGRTAQNGLTPQEQAMVDQRVNQTDATGAGVVGGVDALTMGLADEGAARINAFGGGLPYERNLLVERAYQDALRQRNPGASLAGNVIGSTIGMVAGNGMLRGTRLAPLATKAGGIGTDALYGAGYGYGSSDENRLSGALTGAAGAAAGNFVGNKLVGGIGRVTRGVSDPAVQYLASRGVPMTPGQLFGESGLVGRSLRGVEDKMESVPFLGDAIRSRREEGLQAFNREAFKDALHPIGQTVEGNIGQDAIDQAHGMVSNAYGDALNGVRLRADGPFIRETDRIIADGSKVPQLGEQFNYLVSNKIDPLFDDSLRMGGREFQSALQTLSKAGSEFPKQGIMGQEAGNYSRDLKDSFINLANRQAPHVAPALQAANSANRNVSILGDAVLAGINQSDRGMFTPAMVNRATIANAKKYGGKKAAQAGRVPFADLAEAGQSVLPSRVPNSGTTDRALATFLLPTALGGAAAGSDSMDLPAPVTTALALAAAGTTKRGNKLIQKLATSRSPEAIALGEEILKRKRLGGMFGAGLAIPFYGN